MCHHLSSQSFLTALRYRYGRKNSTTRSPTPKPIPMIAPATPPSERWMRDEAPFQMINTKSKSASKILASGL
jgi:hypothetical protein